MVAIFEKYAFPEMQQAMIDTLVPSVGAPAGDSEGHELHDLESGEGSGNTDHQPPSQPVTPTPGAE